MLKIEKDGREVDCDRAQLPAMLRAGWREVKRTATTATTPPKPVREKPHVSVNKPVDKPVSQPTRQPDPTEFSAPPPATKPETAKPAAKAPTTDAIETPEEPPVDKQEPDDNDTPDFSKMRKEALLKFAEENGFEVDSHLKVDEIRQLLAENY